MKFDETPAQSWNRIRNGGGRKPLRTFAEMAEEFGLTSKQLTAKIRWSAGPPFPDPVIKHEGQIRNTWYNPVEVRDWWRQYKAKPKGSL